MEVALSKPTEKMWDNLLITFKTILSKSESTYLNRAQTFNCTEEENTLSLSILRKRAWLALHGKIREQLSDHAILAKLRDQFEDSFRYDRQGVPRVWTPGDDIDGEFRKAKEQVGRNGRKSWRSIVGRLTHHSDGTDLGLDPSLFQDHSARS